jgi:hypothetical protein
VLVSSPQAQLSKSFAPLFSKSGLFLLKLGDAEFSGYGVQA